MKRLLPLMCLWLFVPAAAAPPVVRLADRVNAVPRPYDGRLDVPTTTTIYFEVVVPVTNLPAGEVDTDTVTATLTPSGGTPAPMILAGQQLGTGFSGTITPDVQDAFASEVGDGFYVIPATPLDPNRTYTVDVYAETLDGQVIDPARDSWSFTTRPSIADATVSWTFALDDPTVRWEGWFHTGIVKPNFGTSRLFDQSGSYALMDQVNAVNPDAWSLQRDWPLTSDYWHNGVFDGNPNIVREIETRQIVAMADQGQRTTLTLVDLEEGPLYGIAPDRPLSGDYRVGDVVTIADREKFEVATVESVDDAKSEIKVSRLQRPAATWILDYPGSHPDDLAETPDNFTLPLCYLRKLDPVGTLAYYWTRLDDEWDVVHGVHGRRLQVNFSYTPLALSSEPVPADPGGHGSTSPPKNWLQWHAFVRELTFHVIDRYGEAAENFYWSVGNENNFSIFWSGGKDGFYELYDYTVNAVLTAFEDRGLDANAVQVGGIEAAGLGGRSWTRDAMYHASGAADRPGGGIAEQNFVCSNPDFASRLAARVGALCDTYSGRGSPLDFVSIHEYDHASVAVNSMTVIRDDALAMDPAFYADLNVTSFENTPDWIPRNDFASRLMFEGNGYFPTWAAEWVHRMVARAETDVRYARHESVLTVWPFDYNGSGQTSITGLLRVDDDGDLVEDRVVTIKKGIFNFIELLAELNRDLDALPARTVEGIRFAAVRSPGDAGHRWLVFNHDKYDTESVEPTEFTAQFEVTQVPWRHATVRRWRLDRDHSSPYWAYQELPARDSDTGVYTPAEVAPLEASDDLVEDGAPIDLAVADGAVTVTADLRVNGVVLIDLRERDLDGDGLGDGADNCPESENPLQEDGDADGAGTACDCDDADPEVWSVPTEARGLALSHANGTTTLSWQPPADAGGTAPAYDTLRSDTPADFSAAVYVESGDPSDTTATDTTEPAPGALFSYLVRATNACGDGPLGTDTGGGADGARF